MHHTHLYDCESWWYTCLLSPKWFWKRMFVFDSCELSFSIKYAPTIVENFIFTYLFDFNGCLQFLLHQYSISIRQYLVHIIENSTLSSLKTWYYYNYIGGYSTNSSENCRKIILSMKFTEICGRYLYTV